MLIIINSMAAAMLTSINISMTGCLISAVEAEHGWARHGNTAIRTSSLVEHYWNPKKTIQGEAL